MSRRPHYCYYHSRFREEASKCKTSESGPRCEFQKLKEGINRKMVPDWRNEEYLYKRRADTEENVEEENLFTRKSDEENYVIHVSEAQEGDTTDSENKGTEMKNETEATPNIQCTPKNIREWVAVVQEEGDEAIEIPTESDGAILISTLRAQFPGVIGLKFRNPETNTLRGIRCSDEQLYPPNQQAEASSQPQALWGKLTYICTRAKTPTRPKNTNCETPEKPNHGMPINKKSRNKCPVPGCKASNQPTEKRDSAEAHRFVLNCPRLQEMSGEERWNFYKMEKCQCKKCFSTEHNWDSCPLVKRFPKFCKEKKRDGTICGGKHHQYLHWEKRRKNGRNPVITKIWKPSNQQNNNTPNNPKQY